MLESGLIAPQSSFEWIGALKTENAFHKHYNFELFFYNKKKQTHIKWFPVLKGLLQSRRRMVVRFSGNVDSVVVKYILF